jgi:hypothetical protein
MTRKHLYFGIFVLILAWFGKDGQASGISGGVPAPVQLTTANANNNRDGWFSNEMILNPSNVAGGHFGKLFTWSLLTGRVNAQVLIAPGITTGGVQRDLLIVTTMGGSIYAFDANNFSANPVWTATMPSGFADSDGLLYNEVVACLSTPVIDLPNSLLYAVCATSTPVWTLYKIHLSTGVTVNSVAISGQYPGTGDPMGGDTVIGGQLQFKPNSELQRAALTLANGNVYIGFGSFADARPWHGWVFSYKQSDLSQQAVFCASPSSYGSGFWGSGAGFSLDASGNLYVFLGNGHYDGLTAWGFTIMKLSPGLLVLDWFTPSNWATLETNDSDLSSSRAMLMTTANGSTLLVGGAKDFRVYVVDSACMGHLQGSGSGCTAPQLFLTNAGTPGSHVGIYGGAFAANTVFMPNTGGNLYAYAFSPSTGLFNTTPVASSSTFAFPGAHPSYSSNGNFNGILWATTAASSAENSAQAGTLRAFNPVTMAELYNSDAQGGDTLGQLNKFNPPTVWNGKVFVGSGSNVVVYGLGAR